MRGNGKRRLALLLALVMTGTLLAGRTTLAKEYGYGDKAAVETLQPGDVVRDRIAVPDGYAVYENGSEKNVFYDKYDFDENGNFQGCGGRYIQVGKEIPIEGGFTIESRTIEIESVVIDEAGKTIRITGDYLYKADGPDEFGFDERYVKAGETVTFTLPGWVDESQFDRWMIKEWAADITAELGLTEEQLHSTTISFAMPERDISVQAVLKDNTTVSGNVPVPPSDDTDNTEDNNNNNDNNNGNNNGSVSDNQSSGGQSSGSSSSSDASSSSAPAYAYDRVTGSDGKVLVSTSPLSFYAADIRGAAVATPKDTVYAAAGLSQEDMDKGTNAKFYVGNPYRKADKDALRQAASQVEGQIISMLTIDLYTITERGWIENVRNLKEGTQESIKMVLGIPAGAVKEGRTFSLVCLDENGKTVELPDTDSDPNTVTVELSRFGSFALIYK